MAKYKAVKIFMALLGIGFLIFFLLVLFLLITHGCSIVKFEPVDNF